MQQSEKNGEHHLKEHFKLKTEKQCRIICGILFDKIYCMTSGATPCTWTRLFFTNTILFPAITLFWSRRVHKQGFYAEVEDML